MIRTPDVPILSNPKLVDKALGEIQTGIAAKLPWLDKVFGRVETMRRVKDGKTQTFPAVYVGDNEYLDLMPDGHIGNYCFFVTDDLGKKVLNIGGANVLVKMPISVIFWWDYRTAFPDDVNTSNSINVVSLVLDAFQGITTRKSSLRVTGWSDDAKQIYKGFTNTDYYQGATSREVRQQFLMRPYGGVRIDFLLRYNDLELC